MLAQVRAGLVREPVQRRRGQFVHERSLIPVKWRATIIDGPPLMSVVAEQSGTPSGLAELPVLRLKRGEDRRLRAGHLWVFSNEVDNEATPLTAFAVGAMARVLSDRDLFLGYAYVNPHA